MSDRNKLLDELYSLLDVNKLSESFQHFVDSFMIENEEEAGKVFYSLYLMAYYVVRGQFENYLKEHPDLADLLNKIIKKSKSNLDIMEAVDKISLAAFGSTFLDKLEQELKKIIDNLADKQDIMVKLTKYIMAIKDEDPKKASQIAEYVKDGRYAKILSIL